MITKYLQFVKTKWFIAVSCLLLGAAIILGIRLVSYKVDAIHYHANFALFINGQREEFKGQQYYSETESCSLETEMVPSERAHMHDSVNNVVHVEDHAVTWGQFFSNLGWSMGPTYIVSPDGTVYAENGDAKLNLLLNGKNYTGLGGLQNSVIRDQDKLLVSYGTNDSSALEQQYLAVPSTAKQYDTAKDPASCSGNHSTDMRDRFKHMF